ncbi:uncharacterized protein LOC127719460 isoform X2 [Mytilus californianus]|uniref:uncharacterized protein LOC127719460 isoform X2 n=1 Tax=Mytilus californianus TaxID=6549 RepID=UPI002245E101|nr:uncharacterized protein LOC127719460 isoform X2 [Mytilus californianus]
MIRCLVFVASIYHVSMTYIYYKQLNRNCLPYYDCEPGNEIQPCTKNFTLDLCAPCSNEMEQPDLISSSSDGDASSTACFKPKELCLAQDITYSRVSKKGYCDHLKECKCKTAICHYGDPCLCNAKVGGCPPNTTLNQSGECIPCPDGTYKNGSGCGPCRHLQKTVPIVTHKMPSNTVGRHTSKSTHFIIAHISSSTFLPLQVNPQKSGGKDDLLIIFIVVLAALVILLSVVTIAICVKRSGFVLAGICWTHGNVQTENDDLRPVDVELGEALIKHQHDNVNIESMTDKGNFVAEYQTKEIPHQCPTFSSKHGEPKESIDSGCHEENESDIVGNFTNEDHKSSTDSVFYKDKTDLYASKQQGKNIKDSPTSSVSSTNEETKLEHDSETKIPKLSMDFSVINNNKNKNLNLSATCSPVTADSEPHTFQLFAASVQEHQGDTSGYQTQSEKDAVPSTSSQSGEYMSMNVSSKY